MVEEDLETRCVADYIEQFASERICRNGMVAKGLYGGGRALLLF